MWWQFQGPQCFFTITQGLSKNKSRIVAGLSGLISANIVWVVLCSVGIGAIIRDSQFLFTSLKYTGAAYLFYLGISILRNTKQTEFYKDSTNNSLPLKILYIQGFLISMSNPKALIFYLSFLPQFVQGNGSYGYQTLIWGLGYVVIVMIVMSLYAIMANGVAGFVNDHRFHKYTNGILGIGFIGASFSVLKIGSE